MKTFYNFSSLFTYSQLYILPLYTKTTKSKFYYLHYIYSLFRRGVRIIRKINTLKKGTSFQYFEFEKTFIYCVTGFTWSDGSPRDYVNWGDDEPNDFYDNEDCVTHYSIWGMKWNDDNCYTLYPYICKIPKGNLPAVCNYIA